MPRPCTVCEHADLKEITSAIMSRVPLRKIQTRYGVSKSALDRHISAHVAKAIRKLASAEMSLPDAAAVAEPVLGEMRKLNARALRILSDAEGAQDRPTALHAIRECRRNLELIARLTGELDPRAAGETAGSPVTVTIQYVDRQMVVNGTPAPSPLPEARESNPGHPDASAGRSTETPENVLESAECQR